MLNFLTSEKRLAQFDYPRFRLIASAVVGLVTFALLSGTLERRLLYAWDAAASTLLLLAWWVILVADPDYTEKSAGRQDIGGHGVGVLAIVSSAVSLLVVVLAFPHGDQKVPISQLLASIVAIAAAWLTVHTTYVFRYAHLYHEGPEGTGLSFRDDQEPDFLDFAYFAFNMGMAYQVADIVPESRAMRRMVFGHALLSYTFGTGIIAVTINILASVV